MHMFCKLKNKNIKIKNQKALLPAKKACHLIEFPKQQMVIHRILNYNFCFYSFLKRFTLVYTK